MKLTLITFLIAGLFSLQDVNAQVSKAKENAKSYKNGDTNVSRGETGRNSSNNGGGSGIGFFFVDIMFQGIGAAHMHMLDRRFDEPWIVSAESQLTAAIEDFKKTGSW